MIDVIRDNSIEVNGRPAMAFLCEYYDPLTKETTVFRSDAVIKSPDRPFVGEIVRVYVNRDERPHYKTYYVDLDTLFTKGDV